MMINNIVSSTNDVTLWERVAETKWGSYTTETIKRAILKAHNLIDKPTTACEVGCEGGRWSKLLADAGWNMICTDINEKTLNICKKRIPTATCFLVDPDECEIPCASDSVNLLLCTEVAPVIQSDWFIKEAFRIMKYNGLLVGVAWNLFSFRGFFSHCKSSMERSFDFYKVIYSSWRKTLVNQGFTLLYEEGFCWFPFRRESNSEFIPYFIRLEKMFRLNKFIPLSPWIVFIAQKNCKSNHA